MDRRQKEKLRFLLKARRRADAVLAKRHADERVKLDHAARLEANRELLKQYTLELEALAEESGVLALAEQTALPRGGEVTRQVNYYIDYGLSSSHLHRTVVTTQLGVLRVTDMAIRIVWAEAAGPAQVEVRVHKNGWISVQGAFPPLFPWLWRRYPRLLRQLFERALAHPRPVVIEDDPTSESRSSPQ